MSLRLLQLCDSERYLHRRAELVLYIDLGEIELPENSNLFTNKSNLALLILLKKIRGPRKYTAQSSKHQWGRGSAEPF